MPLVDANDPTLYDGGANSLYEPALIRTDLWVGGYRGDTAELIKAMESKGLTQGQRIAIIRSEFGWIAEEFVAQGYGPIADGTAAGRIVCVDTSTWIQSAKGSNATLNIVNSDVNGATGRRAIRQQLGSNNQVIDWAISYEVLPMLSDAECAPFASAIRALATNVVHWLTPLIMGPPQQDARLNLKTIAAWKTLMTPDYICERGTANIV